MLVIALAATLIVFGIRTVRHAPLDVFPEFAPPLVEIQTEAPGLSTEEVDALVTVPLENALNGLPWLKTIRSKSVLGLSSVVLIFQDGTDLLRARQLVQERLALAQSRLPAVVKPPVLMSPLFVVEPRAEDRRLVENAVANGTQRTGAVDDPPAADVRAGRGERRHLGPARQAVSSAGGSGATARRRRHARCGDARRRAMRRSSTRADSWTRRTSAWPSASWSPSARADDLARTVVEFRNGAPIRLGDVAEVVIGHPRADWRRGHQRRPRPAADRRETAVGQHARCHARSGDAPSPIETGPRRRGD